MEILKLLADIDRRSKYLNATMPDAAVVAKRRRQVEIRREMNRLSAGELTPEIENRLLDLEIEGLLMEFSDGEE